jgi:sec-independent protein translocase protein TatA
MLTLAFGLPGTTEWIIILIIALLIFGSRLPKVMRSMGQSVNEFKRGMNEMIDEDQRQEEAATADKEANKEETAKDEAKA